MVASIALHKFFSGRFTRDGHMLQTAASHMCAHQGDILQVDVVEDESTGKRTIKTTTICWGNKLSLLVSTPFHDPRLPVNPNDPDLDFSQAQIELNTEVDWQKVCRSWHARFMQTCSADSIVAKSAVGLANIQHPCCACASPCCACWCSCHKPTQLQPVQHSIMHLYKQLRLKPISKIWNASRRLHPVTAPEQCNYSNKLLRPGLPFACSSLLTSHGAQLYVGARWASF